MGIRLSHLLILGHFEFVGATCSRQHLVAVLICREARSLVLLRIELCAISRHQLRSSDIFVCTFQLCFRCTDVALVTVPKRNLNAGLGKALPSGFLRCRAKLLSGIPFARFQIQIGELLALGRLQPCLGECHICLSLLHGGTLLRVACNCVGRIHIRRLHKTSGQRMRSEIDLTSQRGELSEGGEEHSLRVDELDLCLFSRNLRIQYIRGVGLSIALQLMRIRYIVESRLEKPVVKDDTLLVRQRVKECARDVIMNTCPLDLNGEFIRAAFCAIDVTSKSQLASEQELLREESSFFAAVIAAASDFIAGVSDDGIRWQADLTCLLIRTFDVTLCLSQRRVALVSEREEAFNGHRLTAYHVAEQLRRW